MHHLKILLQRKIKKEMLTMNILIKICILLCPIKNVKD